MIASFFDTSALQHRYVQGPYSRRVRYLVGRRSTNSYIADLTVLEMANTLATRCRGSGWGMKTFDRLNDRFLDDIAAARLTVRPCGSREVRRAVHLIRFAGVAKKKGLKSSDALIASCALEFALETQQAVNFYMSDWQLYCCLRDFNAFRTTMNLILLGKTKDGTPSECRVLSSALT